MHGGKQPLVHCNSTDVNPKAYPCCPSLRDIPYTQMLGASSLATLPGGHVPRGHIPPSAPLSIGSSRSTLYLGAEGNIQVEDLMVTPTPVSSLCPSPGMRQGQRGSRLTFLRAFLLQQHPSGIPKLSFLTTHIRGCVYEKKKIIKKISGGVHIKYGEGEGAGGDEERVGMEPHHPG